MKYLTTLVANSKNGLAIGHKILTPSVEMISKLVRARRYRADVDFRSNPRDMRDGLYHRNVRWPAGCGSWWRCAIIFGLFGMDSGLLRMVDAFFSVGGERVRQTSPDFSTIGPIIAKERKSFSPVGGQ